MNRLRLAILASAVLLQLLGSAEAQELSFASAKEAQNILSAQDDFAERMSSFDRAARLKTDRDISEPQFLRFAASAALDWMPHEKQVVEAAFLKIRTEVARLALPLPDRILVIKTSGEEEGNAAYTRQDAIILPRSMLTSGSSELTKIIAHELFHISSRANPRLANALYESIGFQYCGEVSFPASLMPRKITNPDAPKNDHCIHVKLGGQDVWVVPILFSRSPKYDISIGGDFFEYLKLALALVEPPKDNSPMQVLTDTRGSPRVVELQQVSGFFDQVGYNTNYVIHPEEILADNFALLVLRERNVRSPEVLERIRSTLANFNGVEQPDLAQKAAQVGYLKR